jgi:small nuclear ribonucleoprotein (snRNP)-like protein
MNIKLEEVVITNKDGTKFTKVPEIQIKGSNLKFIRIQPCALQKA